ncbi:MAG: hypothetical protein QXH27_05570 [Candidatus Micrarchaeia archaeon]
MNKFTVLLFLLILIPLCSAQLQPKPPLLDDAELDQIVAGLANDTRVRAEITHMMMEIRQELGNRSIPLAELAEKYAVIVTGEDSAAIEGYLLSLAEKRFPQLTSAPKIAASDARPKDLQGKRLVVSIGGPSQNRFTAFVESKGWLTNSTTVQGRGIIKWGRTPWNATVVVLSDARGYANVPMEGIRNSPLAAPLKALGLPAQAVPVASFGLSVLFLMLFPIFRVYAAGFLKSKDRQARGAVIKPEFTGVSVKGVRLKAREAVSVFMGSFFYGSGIALAFTGVSLQFFLFVIVAVLFVCLMYYSRTIARLISDALFKTHTEYIVWPLGSALCLVTGFFGATLQTPGYELEEAPGEKAHKLALMKSLVVLVTILIGIAVFAINFLFPNQWLPVLRLSASAIAATEILPIAPMPGAAIKRWNFFMWLALFLFVTPSYFLINFYL